MLLPNKTKTVYKKALKVIRDAVNGYNPKEIMIDFKMGFIGAIKSVFKYVVKGCHFIFGQCVIRKVTSLGLQKNYNEDIEFANAIKMLIALAFVRPEDVDDSFTELVNSKYYKDNFEDLAEIVDY